MAATTPAGPADRSVLRRLTRAQLIWDAAIAVVFAALCVLGAASVGGWAVAVVLVLSTALALRRLSPGIALAVAWVGAILQMATVQSPAPADVAILAVLYATAAYGGRAVRWTGLASAVAGSVVGAFYLTFIDSLFGVRTPDAAAPSRLLLLTLFWAAGLIATLGLSWTLGLLARTIRLSREARIQARIAADRAAYDVAVEQERTRIARDMHDVVAHSLAVVIAQADGARYAAAADASAQGAALVTIAATARGALADVRVLLAELRSESAGPLDAPQPSVADITALVERARSAGASVALTETGTREPLGATHEIAAYRIVQEAVTNALRHARPHEPITVALAWQDGELEISVENAVPALEAPPVAGHGIAGMSERAALAGGRFDWAVVGGRFRITARIPAIQEEGA